MRRREKMGTGAVASRSRLFPALHLLIFILLFAGCAKSSLRPYASSDFKAGKMAILPFDNLSTAQGAAKAMENLVLVEFLKLPHLTIVEPGEVAAALSLARVRLATNIPRETIIKLGQDLGVDLLMVGVVHEHDVKRFSGAGGSGEIPVVSLSLRILETQTGNIVWAANANRAGNDRETVFGMGRVRSINELAANTATELARACATSFVRS
jgi:PBP1b-binding outer membrane lipoprotein LpoB